MTLLTALELADNYPDNIQINSAQQENGKFWFRNFFEGKTFYKSGGKWYDYKYYQEEHKIEEDLPF